MALLDRAATGSTSAAVKATLAMSTASLLLSGFVLLETMGEDGFRDDVDRRLACLEKDGANDCGVDGR